MFGFAAVDYVAVRSLGSAEVAAAETAAVQSVDAVGGGCEEAAAIAIRTAVAVEGTSGMIVAAAAAALAVEEVVRMLDMAVAAEEEEGQEEEAGNTARLELGSACRN